MQCKEWDDANSELFKESHDEAVHKNSYKSRLYELISASLVLIKPKQRRLRAAPFRPPMQSPGSEFLLRISLQDFCLPKEGALALRHAVMVILREST